MVLYCLLLSRAAQLTSEEDTEATSRVLPGDDMPYNAPYERIKPSSKVKNVCLSVCLCQIFDHQFNQVTFTHQHGGNKFHYGKLRFHFKRLLTNDPQVWTFKYL